MLTVKPSVSTRSMAEAEKQAETDLMGMLVDDVSGNILSAAILLPVAVSIGIDPIHFAAISVTNLSLGNVTPPMRTHALPCRDDRR